MRRYLSQHLITKDNCSTFLGIRHLSPTGKVLSAFPTFSQSAIADWCLCLWFPRINKERHLIYNVWFKVQQAFHGSRLSSMFSSIAVGECTLLPAIGLAAPTCVNVKNTFLLQKGGSRCCTQVANPNLSNCLQFLIAHKDRHLPKDKETKPWFFYYKTKRS